MNIMGRIGRYIEKKKEDIWGVTLSLVREYVMFKRTRRHQREASQDGGKFDWTQMSQGLRAVKGVRRCGGLLMQVDS